MARILATGAPSPAREIGFTGFIWRITIESSAAPGKATRAVITAGLPHPRPKAGHPAPRSHVACRALPIPTSVRQGGTTMAEKGLNRGGVGGQEADLEQGNPEQRPGWQQEQGSLQRKKSLDQPKRNQGAQRGGLQREPNLTGREEETGHEVD
jgi:hypothetical protein